jgi:DNA-binding response OmpR family regulator
MKVLVIEDNQILGRNLVRYLSTRDIFTDLCFDGEEGLKKVFQSYYDIIILDINLPKISGLDICKAIREKEKEVSILMLTSLGTNDDIVNGLNM